MTPHDATVSEVESVALLITSLLRAGAETQMVRLAKGLRERDYEVRLASLRTPEAFASELERAGIPISSLDLTPGVPNPLGLWRLVRLFREWRPDVLITFMVHANVVGRLAGAAADIPGVISSIRTQDFGGRHRDWMVRATDALADVTVVNSHLVAENAVERGIVPKERVVVIPNALPAGEYQLGSSHCDVIREELRVDNGTFLWLAVGRLEEQKDYQTMLRAFGRLLRERQDVRLAVAGQGEALPRLKSLASRLGIEAHVRFLGLRNDVPKLLAGADALVLSSVSEGLPNIVMEALAASVPVVATAVGGVPELVKDGHTGYLAESGNDEDLSQQMMRMMESPDEDRKRMGERGRNMIEERYGIESVIDRWENLIHSVGSYKKLRGQTRSSVDPNAEAE